MNERRGLQRTMLNRLLDNQYELLAALKASDFGVTHYGWDHRGQRPVAVKEVFADRAGGDAFLRRLAEDADRYRRFSHPSMVAVYDLRQDLEGRVWVIMEFLDGIGLDAALGRVSERQKRLPPALTLYIARQILLGLDHVYSHGGLAGHTVRPLLGLCPSGDVTLVAGGTVKLSGFGVSRTRMELRQRPDAELSGNHPGSPAERADLHAVGSLLYELLAGQSPPGPGEHSSPGMPQDVPRLAGLPKPLAEIVRRALAPDAGQRYRAAQAMLDDVQAAEAALGASDGGVMLADLLDALEDPEEARTHRRLLMMRGSASGETQPVVTTPLRPESLPRSGVADAAIDSDANEFPRPANAPSASIEPVDLKERAPRRRAWLVWLLAAALIGYVVADAYWGFGPVRRLAGMAPAGARDGTATCGTIVSVPPGAELSVNGVFAGRTPCTLDELPVGPVTLRLVMPGLLPVDTVLVVSEGETPGALPPFVFHCRVHFNSVPAGASVIVDGHELSDIEKARFAMIVTDTINVVMTVEGEQPLPAADFNPLVGFVSPADTAMWRWRPRSEEAPGELTGVFRRDVRVHSDPPGALVFIDGDSAASGMTDLALPLPYGDHIITLHREPFMDYRFAVNVGRETPGFFTAVLKRTVHIRAIDRADPATDIGATIEWIRQGVAYVKTPFDAVKTPYSIQLGGLEHEIRLRCEAYRDTTVKLNSLADHLEVVMRPLSTVDRESRADRDDNLHREAWISFQVNNGNGPIAGAEVIGVEKSTGVIVRYGATGEGGQIVTTVPPGDYDWRATKQGYEGRINGERIKPGKDLKKITLRLDKR